MTPWKLRPSRAESMVGRPRRGRRDESGSVGVTPISAESRAQAFIDVSNQSGAENGDRTVRPGLVELAPTPRSLIDPVATPGMSIAIVPLRAAQGGALPPRDKPFINPVHPYSNRRGNGP